VIPAKNEAANIAWVLTRIPAFVDEVVIVDGLSTDGTLEVAKGVNPDVIAVHEPRHGKGAAVRTGFAVATGDYVVMLDADGSMDPTEIGRFVAALDAGADLAKGSRYILGGSSTDLSVVRDFGNRMLLAIANGVYRSRFTELCYGYMALRRAALGGLDLSASGFDIEAQIVARALRAGLTVVEVASTESRRHNGISNLNPVTDGSRVLWALLRERRWRGVRRSVAIPIETEREIREPTG
jgi:glycosyltransferase involved in cell wall biosynthesis